MKVTIEIEQDEVGLLIHSLEKIRESMTGRDPDEAAYEALRAMKQAADVRLPSVLLGRLAGLLDTVAEMAREG